MKNYKKVLAMILGMAMTVSLFAGCGNSGKKSGESSPQAEIAPAQEESASSGTESKEEAPVEETEEAEGTGGFSGTLKLYGPGLFTDVGPDGNTDIVTGVSKPGYNVVVDRWKELYPDVELQIETIPWDNWKAACQTAALSGDVDIIIHGSSIVPICEPLSDYLEKDPQVKDSVGMMAMRKNSDIAPLSEYIPYGLTVTVNPVMVVVDKEIFEHYGLELPDSETWTLDDVMELAKAATGTDPVTGKQTYGMGMIEAASANKNYIWASRAFNNTIYEWGDSLATTNVNFVNDTTKEVLNYLTELSRYASPDYMEGLDKANAYTVDNNLAIMITESAYSAYNTIKAAGLEDKYMFAALPKIQGGEFDGITSSHMGDWNMAICNTSSQKDLAWEFLKFMVMDEVVQQWLLDTYSIPANKEASAKLGDYMPDDYAAAISYVVNTSPLEFSASANNCYDSSNFGTFANDLTTVLNEMFQGNMDADAAIAYVKKNLDDYMSTLN